MRTIDANAVRSRLTQAINDCLICPDSRVTEKLAELSRTAPSELERTAAALIVKNNTLAAERGLYACQDTGQAVVFVRLGDEAHCPGLANAITRAVRDAYRNARKSVADPITRINTGDNTPAIIETELISGDTLEITFLAKGAGSENMSRLYMLKPSDGTEGIVRSVEDAVEQGGRNACPPLVVGVGIGGVTETACKLSKKALLRPLGTSNARADIAELESALLKRVNALGIGIAALGGAHTALAVNIEVAPTHIGMLPVAVNLQCHSLRHSVIAF